MSLSRPVGSADSCLNIKELNSLGTFCMAAIEPE